MNTGRMPETQFKQCPNRVRSLCSLLIPISIVLLLTQRLAVGQNTNSTDQLRQEVDSAQLRSPARSEISIPFSASLGQGSITMPFGFSLAKGAFGVQQGDIRLGSPDRSSFYYGATFSHSFSKKWYLDASYARGSSSGTFRLPALLANQLTDFEIDDNWYQLYVRYAFPQFGVTRLSPYLRIGITYMSADLSVADRSNGGALYRQRDDIQDILGNIGFGLLYSLYTGDRVRLGIQAEGEGFFGHRFQDMKETLNGVSAPSATVDNVLYGGIGRLTGRFQYALGNSGLLKLFADGGIESRYTLIRYEQIGNESELLWGPYGRIGLSYSF